MNFRKGSKVYAVRPGNSQVGEYKFALAGVDHAFLHMPKEWHDAPEGELFPIPLTHVFRTKAEAKAFANTLGVKVGDVVAVTNYNTYRKGLVVKTTDTMFEMVLADTKDIQHNGGKMKSRHYKKNAIVLVRGTAV
jgi:hypothetical protein